MSEVSVDTAPAPASTELSLSIQQAFAASKAEHSAPEPTPTETATTETAEAPPTQHTDASPVSATEAPESLISDADFQAIQAKFPDPAKQRAEVNRVWTQKTQALAETRKTLEPWVDFIESLETNSEAAVRQLAERYGLSIAVAKPPETVPAAPDYTSILKESLGPDLDFLAPSLGPAMQKIAESIAAKLVDERIAPLAASTQGLVNRTATEQTEAVMTAFTAKHPDWQQFEAPMMALAQQLNPKGMKEGEFLDLLYTVATRDRAQGEAAKKAVARMTAAAETAETASRTVPESQVTRDVNKRMTIREAWDQAKRESVAR